MITFYIKAIFFKDWVTSGVVSSIKDQGLCGYMICAFLFTILFGQTNLKFLLFIKSLLGEFIRYREKIKLCFIFLKFLSRLLVLELLNHILKSGN